MKRRTQTATYDRQFAKLKGRIDSLRTRQTGVFGSYGALILIGGLVLFLTGEMFFDWLLELAWGVRLLLFLVCMGGAGFVFWWFFYLPWKKRPNDDAVALMIERAMPVFRTRFIASIQLARSAQSSALAQALVSETAEMASKLNFGWVIKTEHLKKTAKIVLLILLTATLIGLLEGRAGTWALLQRAFLLNVPVPHNTNITSVTGACVVGIGDDLTLSAVVSGYIPRGGRIMVHAASGRDSVYPMEADAESHGRFHCKLDSVQESFSYSVRLNDCAVGPFQVQAKPRPTILSIKCMQIYPAYTGLGSAPRKVGDLSLLAGSKLNLEIKASNPLKRAWIRSAGLPQEVPMQINFKQPMLASGALSIPAKDLEGFSIQMIDSDGVASKDTAVYRINLLPDRPPEVKITYPLRREELITGQGTLLIGFSTTDDFGVGKVALHYTVDQTGKGEEKTIEFNLDSPSRNLQRRFDWKISTLQPPPPLGSTIEFWIEAMDDNNITGPGIGVSDHYQAKLVTEKDKRADISNRLTNTMESMEEVVKTQEDQNKELGKLIIEKPRQTR